MKKLRNIFLKKKKGRNFGKERERLLWRWGNSLNMECVLQKLRKLFKTISRWSHGKATFREKKKAISANSAILTHLSVEVTVTKVPQCQGELYRTGWWWREGRRIGIISWMALELRRVWCLRSALWFSRKDDQLQAIWNADLSTSSYPITEKTSMHSLWAQVGGYPDIPMLLQLDVQSAFIRSLTYVQSR